MDWQEKNMGERSRDPILADIRENWHWVKPGLETIIAENKFLDVLPEDVYTACKTEAAHLWIKDEGFVITMGFTDEFTGKRTLLIWFAWAKEHGTNIAIECQSFFIRVAKEAGFTSLEVRTPYDQLGKYISNNCGWELETRVYRLEL
jgi:hypothetical protein